MREIPGRNLKDRIDNWHKNKPIPQVSSNFVGATSSTYAWIDDEPVTPEVRNKLTQKELEELEVLENLVSSAQKKIDYTKKRQAANKLDNEGLVTRAKAQAAAQEKAVPSVPAERSSRPDPQFRYVTPIEDPALIKKLVDQSLESLITISTKELLSVAPDVRRQIKDQLITKRIATSAFVETEEQSTPSNVLNANVAEDQDCLIVAKHAEGLRVIN